MLSDEPSFIDTLELARAFVCMSSRCEWLRARKVRKSLVHSMARHACAFPRCWLTHVDIVSMLLERNSIRVSLAGGAVYTGKENANPSCFVLSRVAS